MCCQRRARQALRGCSHCHGLTPSGGGREGACSCRGWTEEEMGSAGRAMICRGLRLCSVGMSFVHETQKSSPGSAGDNVVGVAQKGGGVAAEVGRVVAGRGVRVSGMGICSVFLRLTPVLCTAETRWQHAPGVFTLVWGRSCTAAIALPWNPQLVRSVGGVVRIAPIFASWQ